MISFVVPAYNEEAELPRTLRAIHSAAEHIGCAYEIVVVDDASTDATAAIGKELGAHVVPIHCRQIAAARNAGAAAALGDTFVFVDADTRIGPQHVSGVLNALNNGFVGGSSRVTFDGQIPWWGRLLFYVFTNIYFAANFGAGAFLFTTRQKFAAMGGFNELYFASEEIFFTLALRRLGRFKILEEPVVTSGRKLRLNSGGKIFLCLTAILLGGRRAVMSRRKLDLWYNGEREAWIS